MAVWTASLKLRPRILALVKNEKGERRGEIFLQTMSSRGFVLFFVRGGLGTAKVCLSTDPIFNRELLENCQPRLMLNNDLDNEAILIAHDAATRP